MALVLAAFFLLYLRVPAGWSPTTGYAPATGAAFLRAFPYPTVSLGVAGFRAAVLASIVAMWAAYGLAAMLLPRVTDPAQRRRAAWTIAGVTIGAHLLLAVLPPVLSSDPFWYALFGRMTLTGLNPYLTPADALSADPLWSYASWTNLRSHYGPTFLWISAGATWLGGGAPVGTALAFKGVVAAFNLVACWAVREVARSSGDGDGLEAGLLYAWNPLVLMEAPGSAHSEAIMVALALLGVLLFLRGRRLTGFGVLVASAAVKYITGLVGLLVLVRTVAAAPPGRRLRTAGPLVAVAGGLLVALYAPFWRGPAVLGAAVELISRGRALEPGTSDPGGPPLLALALFVLLLAAALVRAARRPSPSVLLLCGGLVTFFVLFVLAWRMPWYFLTGIAFTAAAGPGRFTRAARLVALFLGMLAMFLYGALVPSGRA
jgi:hypothetical protein